MVFSNLMRLEKLNVIAQNIIDDWYPKSTV